MNFTFPETIFVAKNSPLEQIAHVLSEAKEVEDEIKKSGGSLADIDLEMMDLYHSCESYFRNRQKVRGKPYIKELVNAVENKNYRRGYYVDAGMK